MKKNNIEKLYKSFLMRGRLAFYQFFSDIGMQELKKYNYLLS